MGDAYGGRTTLDLGEVPVWVRSCLDRARGGKTGE